MSLRLVHSELFGKQIRNKYLRRITGNGKMLLHAKNRFAPTRQDVLGSVYPRILRSNGKHTRHWGSTITRIVKNDANKHGVVS